jgi:hypothetical protein
MTKVGTAVSVEEKVEDFEKQWEKLDLLIGEEKFDRSLKPPTGGILPIAFARKKGISESHARKMLFTLYRAGKIERVKVGNKMYYLIPK